ncbi:invasion associated locus B family protein, partial [Colwellia sp. BRX8-8]|nr:invasion associated locus B family protein [Colwellia sp. BRX8-8]
MIKIDDVLLKEMKNAKVGMIAFALESKKQLTLPISLEGFEAGFKTLK